jgi:pyruvate dehydrogenase E2 component (dihydrolipoamide acetyltransferase)
MASGTVVEVVMPQMGVSVSEGTVTKWLRHVGDRVQADEPLLEISTDKVDTEVPSPGTGVLQEILVQEGETVAVGTLVARIGTGNAETPPTRPSVPDPLPSFVEPEPEPEPEAEPEPEPEAEAEPVAEAPEPETTRAAPATGNGKSGEAHAFISPVVARIAAEHGIDPANVPGTGRDGRVTKKDILAFVESDAARAATPPPLPAPAPAEAAPSPAPARRPRR